MIYMVPALGLPSGPVSLYKTDKVAVKNLVAIPNTAVTHIQKMAPGPPSCIATATPAILPRPMVPERLAVSARK